jgi:dihydroxyacetone kinase-like predicted kinase
MYLTLLGSLSIHCHRYEVGYEENSSITYKFCTEYILHVNNYKHEECPKLLNFTRRIEHNQVRTEAINS